MTFSFNTARPSVIISIAAAAILALTSCSGAATESASTEQKPAASAEQSATVEPTEKAEETEAASSKEYTEAELTAILEGL